MALLGTQHALWATQRPCPVHSSPYMGHLCKTPQPCNSVGGGRPGLGCGPGQGVPPQAVSVPPPAQHHLKVSRRRLTTCRAGAATMTASDAAAYAQLGPHLATELDPITVTVGGDAELPVTAQIQVTVPKGLGRPAPLVILSAGFLLNASLYASYATHLATWGYAVALYDLSEVMDDTGTVTALRRILDTCSGNTKLRPYISSSEGAVLVGHSRGGKLSCLTAATKEGSRVRGLVLLDPVDNTPMTPAGEGYPTSFPGLMRCTAPPRNLPVLIIGAGSGGDVVPESSNFKKFASVSRGPVWNVELKGAGHLAFLDKQVGLFSLFSAPGATPDGAVREATKIALLTWLKHAVYPAPGAASCATAIEAARRAMSTIVRNELTSDYSRMNSLRSATNQTETRSGASSSSQGSSGASQPAASRQKPLTETYETLMQRRAKEIKAMLVERGIPCSDCFEKETLARRLVEACK